jgi:hypothetical protein
LKAMQTAGMCLSRRGKLANQRAEQEQMKAFSRLGNALLAVALALAPAIALAQEAPTSGNAPSPTDSVGPKELQNFTLNGTVTRPADQPSPVQAPPQKRQPPSDAQASTVSIQPRTGSAEAVRDAARTSSAPDREHTEIASAKPGPTPGPVSAPERLHQTPPSSSVTVTLPKIADGGGGATAEPASTPLFAPDPATGTIAPEHRLPILPWLLAALALGAGGAFLFWRSRGREAFAGGPQIDVFDAPAPTRAPAPPAPPRPAPPPPPAQAPPKAAAPSPLSNGIVSTRLRPWIDIGFQPLRCVLENERVVVDFELELFNSGSAPARAVLVEASLFNAGPAQEQQIGTFFANPVGEGERIVVIPPLKRISLKTQVVAPREQVQAYELAGRQVFVPLIAFNTLYRWSGGDGQTSASYLLGRDTKGEKMAPFRLDLGPRIFRGVAGRQLPTAVRE